MPEGDTIYRTAATLRRALADAEVTAVETTVAQVRQLGPSRLVGQRVASVEPRGKHLLCWFAPSDLALHTHMMMSGSWHLYRPGQRWQKPRRMAKIVLSVPGWQAVCFSAPVVELLSRSQVEQHRSLATLGPDALDPDADLVEARRRLDQRQDTPVGDALLDQQVLAGVGNVYRCEVLFLHGVDPATPVGCLPGATRDALLATAVELLTSNVDVGSVVRSTTDGRVPGQRLHVYGRAGRACPRCGAAIRAARQGAHARLVYWCPGCQG